MNRHSVNDKNQSFEKSISIIRDRKQSIGIALKYQPCSIKTAVSVTDIRV